MATARQRQRTRDKRRRHMDKVSGRKAARSVIHRSDSAEVIVFPHQKAAKRFMASAAEVATSMEIAAAADRGDCRTVHAGLAVESFGPGKSVDDMTKGELLAYADVIHVKVSKWWTRGRMIEALKMATAD